MPGLESWLCCATILLQDQDKILLLLGALIDGATTIWTIKEII